jgi:hypothetical protein
MEGRSHEVNEYSIGVQVFGKPQNYNPNLDNIVRVTARQLRAKLGEFYSVEGSAEALRIEMPKGSYLVGLTANRPGVTTSAPGNRTPMLLVAAMLASTGWLLAAWLWFSRPSPPSLPGFLLSPILFDRTQPTTLVLDDPVFGHAWRRFGPELGLQGFVSGRYLDDRFYQGETDVFLQRLLAYNSYANASSLDLSLRLSRIAHSAGIEASIVSCRTLRPKQLERGNFIFIGGVSTNPWVSEIQKNLEFEHLTSRSPSPRRYFVNRRPQPGEPAIFTNTESNPDEHYFTRVALLNNPFGPGKVALLGGTSRDATEAAGQFALSQAGLNEISRRCGKPADRLSGFEVILGTKSVGGAHLTHNILASRCRP